MGASFCRKRELEIPAQSSADNIIVDFRINILHPTTEVLYSVGQNFETLGKETTLEIQNNFSKLLTNIDKKAPKIYKYGKNTIIGLWVLILLFIFVLSILIRINLTVYIALIVVLIISLILYNCWVIKYSKKWSNKVFPVILDYVQNEFKSVYSPMIDIHLLYPIRKYRLGRLYENKRRFKKRKMQQILISDWIVIRITNGRLQEPINGPVYWSSNGTYIEATIPVSDMTTEQLPLMLQIQKEEQQTQFISDDIVTSSPVNTTE